MLLYLAAHTHIVITYAINKKQDLCVLSKACAQTCPQANWNYLKATSEKGLIIKPYEKLVKIDDRLVTIGRDSMILQNWHEQWKYIESSRSL